MNEPNQNPKAQRQTAPLAVAPCSASGFWRSARGENHGRDSRPGDVWVEPGDITDTDRIDWLEKHATVIGSTGLNADKMFTPRTHYTARAKEENGLTVREAIDAAMREPNAK